MYIQLDIDYWDHPKTILLTTLLGREAESIPPRLWCWAAKYARDGVIPVQMLMVATGWVCKGHDAVLGALLKSEFVAHYNQSKDENSEKYVKLVNWDKRTGAFMGKYEEKKARMRRYQEDKRRGEESKVSGNYPDTIRILSDTYSGGSSSPSAHKDDEVLRQLLSLAKRQKIAARDDTLTTYIQAWRARMPGGGADVESLLMRPEAVGRTLVELQDMAFPHKPKNAPNRPVSLNGVDGKVKCGVCADTKLVNDWKDGVRGQAPCSCTRRIARA